MEERKKQLKKSESIRILMKAELTVIVDHRELKSAVSKELFELGIKLSATAMEAGDYQASERVGIERKTPEDFVTSLIDGRLFSQAKKLDETFQRPVMLIEGEGDIYSIRKVHENAIQGAISSLMIDYRIPIFRTSGARETARLIVAMAKREQIDLKKNIRIRGNKQTFSTKEWQEYIIASLPGVGLVLAKNLLKRFGSVEKVLTAGPEELVNVEKIGRKKAEWIRDVLEAKYD